MKKFLIFLIFFFIFVNSSVYSKNDLYEKILGEKEKSDPKEFEKVMRDL